MQKRKNYIKNYSKINRRKYVMQKRKNYIKNLLARCPVGLPDLGCANAGPEGPAGSQGSAP